MRVKSQAAAFNGFQRLSTGVAPASPSQLRGSCARVLPAERVPGNFNLGGARPLRVSFSVWTAIP
eukprot:2562950-Rhodomonas_salina.1